MNFSVAMGVAPSNAQIVSNNYTWLKGTIPNIFACIRRYRVAIIVPLLYLFVWYAGYKFMHAVQFYDDARVLLLFFILYIGVNLGGEVFHPELSFVTRSVSVVFLAVMILFAAFFGGEQGAKSEMSYDMCDQEHVFIGRSGDIAICHKIDRAKNKILNIREYRKIDASPLVIKHEKLGPLDREAP